MQSRSHPGCERR